MKITLLITVDNNETWPVLIHVVVFLSFSCEMFDNPIFIPELSGTRTVVWPFPFYISITRPLDVCFLLRGWLRDQHPHREVLAVSSSHLCVLADLFYSVLWWGWMERQIPCSFLVEIFLEIMLNSIDNKESIVLYIAFMMVFRRRQLPCYTTRFGPLFFLCQQFTNTCFTNIC